MYVYIDVYCIYIIINIYVCSLSIYRLDLGSIHLTILEYICLSVCPYVSMYEKRYKIILNKISKQLVNIWRHLRKIGHYSGKYKHV